MMSFPNQLAKISVAIFALSLTSYTYAEERELAADGDAVKLTIDKSYRCSNETPIKITTKSAGYYDLGAETIQRLADTSRAIMGFECPDIKKFTFTGFTDGIIVFEADAKHESKWVLESEPAPLERLALFLSLYEPDFFYLGNLHEQLEPFKEITGIASSYQFKAYEKQIKRYIKIVDGDTDKFQDYIRNPGRDLGSFENALAHYSAILKTIKKYTPEHFAAYKAAYDETTESLKNDYWSSQIAIVTDSEEQTIAEMVEKTKLKVNSASSPEFATFIDSHIANSISEEALFVKEDLTNATLFELTYASDFIVGFPEPSEAEGLPAVQAVLKSIPEEIVPIIMERKNKLQSLAAGMIRESGASYEDADVILETGFALAEEFEDAGYPEDGEALIAISAEHIQNILDTGIEDYRSQLDDIDLNTETITALQEKAITFEELGSQFEGFIQYKEAVENKLNTSKDSICASILKEAGADESDFDKNIHIGERSITLASLACELQENGHEISEFSSKWMPNEYILAISEANGGKSRFSLKADTFFFGKDLHVKSKLDEEELPFEQHEWKEYIAQLVLPPPSGLPDSAGIRECDRLAADPFDPGKLSQGIDFENDEVEPDKFDRAIDACIAAVEDDPSDARQQYQLGRLLWYAGDQDGALEYIDLAAAENYAPALYYKAEILLGSSEEQDAFIDALDLFKASGKAGYTRGTTMVNELNPDGIDFYKEIPPPTSQNILSALPRKKAGATFLGVTSSAKIVDIKIKSCFQISATDFSCEFKKILKCGMSGYGNDPIMRFMSAAMQADCNTSLYEFKTFRKTDHKLWEMI